MNFAGALPQALGNGNYTGDENFNPSLVNALPVGYQSTPEDLTSQAIVSKLPGQAPMKRKDIPLPPSLNTLNGMNYQVDPSQIDPYNAAMTMFQKILPKALQ